MKAVIIDTETTGLTFHPSAKQRLQPRIIEFGMIVVDDDLEVVGEFNQLTRPPGRITEEITKITGITNEDLADAPEFRTIIPKIVSTFVDCDILIAHNLPFDKRCLMNELSLAGHNEFPWPRIQICTVQDNLHRFGFRPSLEVLFEHETGIKPDQTHRAIEDCYLLLSALLEGGSLDVYFSTAARAQRV